MQFNLLEVLEYIDPSMLSYTEWVQVGMALKAEGYTAYDWDTWSAKDSKRYVVNDCYNKWETFTESGITGATITQMAKDYGGWESSIKEGHELDWNDTIYLDKDDYKLIQSEWVEELEVKPLFNKWDPKQEIKTYIETLFELDSHIGYATQSYKNDKGKWLPSNRSYDRTAEKLLQLLNVSQEISDVFGDYHEEAGAWVHFNPFDGKGVKNENVTDHKYTLVECDNQTIEKQYAILKELELPIAVLVHSGKKSLHAIVKVNARNKDEYKKRVDFIYTICKRNGLDVDTQNKNPSRLSRFPGFERDGKKQYIIGINLGKKDYEEWVDHIEDLNDGLPEFESLEDTWDNLPPLEEELIKGVLRQGHKMLVAGPSKAGKTFILMNLAISIAEGLEWVGWKCKQGKVLYINLEVSRPSGLHRFKDIYDAMKIAPKNVANIHIWNLRGNTVPMDKLAPKIIRRAAKKGYVAVIIDPIYKVLTGDENSAEQMAHFTNQFDKVATELGTSVIYCHHHSKGSQGGKKSMDRASGSGVFARDPDALLDLVELPLNEHVIKCENDKIYCDYYYKKIEQKDKHYLHENIEIDETFSKYAMSNHLKEVFSKKEIESINQEIEKVINEKGAKSAWRIEGTLREFAKFKPKNIWFEWPLHTVDNTGVLNDLQAEDEAKPAWKKAMDKRKNPEDKKNEKLNKLEIAYASLEMEGKTEITYKDLEEALGRKKLTIMNLVKEHPNFDTVSSNGKPSIVVRKTSE